MERRNIFRQSSHTQPLSIYEEKGHWYAYGSSAQLMRQWQKGFAEMKLLVDPADGVAADRIEVDFRTVVEKFTIVLCSDTEIVLECPDLEERHL